MILLNRQRVMVECLMWAQFQIADILKVHPKDVEAKWSTAEGGKLQPEFNVDMDAAEGLNVDEVKQVMAQVYGNVKAQLFTRLVGLQQRRGN